MKLAIGTANFFSNYGLNKYKLNSKKIFNILNLAKKLNILYLDCALSYGTYKSISKDSILKKFKITSKIIVNKTLLTKKKYEYDLLKSIEKHIKNLKIDFLENLLVHNFYEFSKKDIYFLSQIMEKIKKNGLTKNIGISVYETKELEATWNIWQPNVVQLPINVIDRRFLIEGWINKLYKNGIDIHARSIFLQGVLININSTKRKFRNNNLFNTFFEWCFKKNIQPLEACINFVKYLKINRIILGIDNHKQLLNLYNYFKISDRITFTRGIASNNLNFIDPRKW